MEFINNDKTIIIIDKPPKACPCLKNNKQRLIYQRFCEAGARIREKHLPMDLSILINP